MRSALFLIPLALSSAACSDLAEDAVAPAGMMNAAEQPPVPPAPPTAPAEAGEEFTDNAEQGEAKREFAYSWPAAVVAEPALVQRLEAERDEQLAQQKAEWAEALTDSPEGCIACINRGFEKEWKVVADLPRYLSLSADLYVYSGGAHGNYGRTSLVWDRETGTAVEGVDLFRSPVALETALGARLCDALDHQRAERRGAPVERTGEWSADCPGIDEATVFVGSSNGETFDRIGIYFGPYVAGSYAEGPYELDFPATASVLDAVKPEYAKAFTLGR